MKRSFIKCSVLLCIGMAFLLCLHYFKYHYLLNDVFNKLKKGRTPAGVTIGMASPIKDDAQHDKRDQHINNLSINVFSESSHDLDLRPSVCTPHNTIMLLKTHKCASTTVQRILLRYGFGHGLTFVLRKKSHQLGYPDHFSKEFIGEKIRSPDNRYHILAGHMRLQPRNVKEVMKKGAKWITIVREPSALFESLWDYYYVSEMYNMDEFLQLSPAEAITKKQKYDVPLTNTMTFDFGFDRQAALTSTNFSSQLQEVAKQFDLVMITERFDESLILLKHQLCWSTRDIAYVKINFRDEKKKSKLSKEVKDKIRKINPTDAMIYQYFAQIFEEKVRKFGEDRMRKEVEELEIANSQLYNECIAEEIFDDPRLFGHNSNSWKVKKNSFLCISLVLEERAFIRLVRQRQTLWRESKWTLNMTKWAAECDFNFVNRSLILV